MRRLPVLAAAALAAAFLAVVAATVEPRAGSATEREEGWTALPGPPRSESAPTDPTSEAGRADTSGSSPGARAAAPLEDVDGPPAGMGRLEVELRYVDGGAVAGVVPVSAAAIAAATREVTHVEAGERGSFDLPPGAYRVAVDLRSDGEDSDDWLSAGSRSRAEVRVVEGEVAVVALAVVRAGALVASLAGDAHPALVPIVLRSAGPGQRSTFGSRGRAVGRDLVWTRLRPGRYELRGGALASPVPVTIVPGKTEHVAVRPVLGRLVVRVRVTATDGSGPHPVPATVSMRRLHEGNGGGGLGGAITATARPDEPADTRLSLASYEVSAAPLDGFSFAARLEGTCEETIVDLTAPGDTVELDLELVLDAPEGVAVVDVEVEGRSDVWLHATDGSQPPVRVARRGVGIGAALDVAAYGSGGVELTDSSTRGEGRTLANQLLKPGENVWSLVVDD